MARKRRSFPYPRGGENSRGAGGEGGQGGQGGQQGPGGRTEIPERLLMGESSEVERAKAWWNANGRAILVGVALGLGAVFGFNYWQNYQQTQAENASLLFDRLLDALGDEAVAGNDAAEGGADGEGDAGSASAILAGDLMGEYARTPYAAHAALAVAKAAVEGGDLPRAVEALRWAVENARDGNLRHVARLRLAAVLLAQGEADAVLELLEVEERAQFAARYYELSGDAHLQKGDVDNARGAYQLSLDSLTPGAVGQRLIQLKRDNLGN